MQFFEQILNLYWVREVGVRGKVHLGVRFLRGSMCELSYVRELVVAVLLRLCK